MKKGRKKGPKAPGQGRKRDCCLPMSFFTPISLLHRLLLPFPPSEPPRRTKKTPGFRMKTRRQRLLQTHRTRKPGTFFRLFSFTFFVQTGRNNVFRPIHLILPVSGFILFELMVINGGARAVFLEKPFCRKFRREVLLFLEPGPGSTAPEMRPCSMNPHSDEST